MAEAVALASVVVVGLAFMVSGWTAHIDDTDAQLYQTVARHMVQDGHWLDLRYGRGVYPHFREHLPFGLWPFAAAIRVFGENALPVLAGAFTLLTLLLVGRVASVIGGLWASVTSLFMLALCESFMLYGGRPRLDPLLILLANGAALPLLLPTVPKVSWVRSQLLASLACLVKGPFGLVPVAAAVLARFVQTRSISFFIRGVLLCVLAVLPMVGFLLWDRAFAGGTYWTGYLQDQLLASASGIRHDGARSVLFPLETFAGRFWPGLPFVVFALGTAFWSRASRRRPSDSSELSKQKLLALFCLFGLAALCIPGRKVWNHVLVIYPGFALLAGVGCAPGLRRWVHNPRRERVLLVGLGMLAVAAWVFVLTGQARRFFPQPCVVAQELSSDLSALPPGSDIAVVSYPPHWKTVAALSAEKDLSPWVVRSAERLGMDAPPDVPLALVSKEQALEMDPSRWVQRTLTQRGWVLFERRIQLGPSAR